MSLKLSKNTATVAPLLTAEALLQHNNALLASPSSGVESNSPSSKTAEFTMVKDPVGIATKVITDLLVGGSTSSVKSSHSTSKVAPTPISRPDIDASALKVNVDDRNNTSIECSIDSAAITIPPSNDTSQRDNSITSSSWRESCGACAVDSATSSQRSKHSKKLSLTLIPSNEDTRLEILRKSKLISDESIRDDVNNILELATRVFKVPTSFINLIDTDWLYFKSIVGANFTVTPRDGALCAYIICQEPGIVIHSIDTLRDERFQNNPNVTCGPKIRFYAGFPITLHNCNLGTFCIADMKPRESFSENDCKILKEMGLIITDILAEKEKRNQFASTVDSSKFVVSMCQGLKPALSQVSYHKEQLQCAYHEWKQSTTTTNKPMNGTVAVVEEQVDVKKDDRDTGNNSNESKHKQQLLQQQESETKKETEKVKVKEEESNEKTKVTTTNVTNSKKNHHTTTMTTTSNNKPTIILNHKQLLTKQLTQFQSSLSDLNKEIETMLQLGHFSLQNIFPSSSSSIVALSKESERKQYGLDSWLEELKHCIILPSYYVSSNGFHDIQWKLNYHSGMNSLITEVNTEILALVCSLLISRCLLRWHKLKIMIDIIFKHIALGVGEGIHRSSCQLIVRVIGSHMIQSEKVDEEMKYCEEEEEEEEEVEEEEKDVDDEQMRKDVTVTVAEAEAEEKTITEKAVVDVDTSTTSVDNTESSTVPNSPRHHKRMVKSSIETTTTTTATMNRGGTGTGTGTVSDTASTTSLDSLKSTTSLSSSSRKHQHHHHNRHQLKHFHRDTNFKSLDFATLQQSDLFVSQFILQGLRGTLTYNKKERDKDSEGVPRKMSKLQEIQLKRQQQQQQAQGQPKQGSTAASEEPVVPKVLIGEEYVLSVPCKIVWNHGVDEASSLENEVLLYSLAESINNNKNKDNKEDANIIKQQQVSITGSRSTQNLGIQSNAMVPQQPPSFSNVPLVKKLNLDHLTIDTNTTAIASSTASGALSPPFCKSPVAAVAVAGSAAASPRKSKCTSPRLPIVTGSSSPRSTAVTTAAAATSTFSSNVITASSSASVSISSVSQIMNQASKTLADAIKRPFKVSTASVWPLRTDQEQQQEQQLCEDGPFSNMIFPQTQ